MILANWYVTIFVSIIVSCINIIKNAMFDIIKMCHKLSLFRNKMKNEQNKTLSELFLNQISKS